MLFLKKFVLGSLAFLLLVSCSQQTDHSKNTLRVGVIAGPEAKLMDVAKTVAEQKYGLNIQVVQFNDYVMPNTALASGDIDANMFQHLPYLEQTIKAKGYDLVSAGKTFIYPMALYSKKITHLADLKDGATVAIPNDPSNETRALLLLQRAGLITLKSGTDHNATVNSIASNPKKLKIVALDAAQLPRALYDVDLAAINTNYAIIANLSPKKDGLLMEDKQSLYANIVAVRAQNRDDPRVEELIQVLHSPEVIAEAKHLFKDNVVQGW